MNWRAGGSPRESDEADWQTWSGVQKPPKTGFVLGRFVVGLCVSFFDVALDSWDEREPSDKISDQNRDEGETLFLDSEVVLFVYQGEGLNEHKDQSIGEATEERQSENDGLGQEHLEWPGPCDQDFLSRESLSERYELVWPVEVGGLAALASLLRNFVHHNGGSGLGNADEVQKLDKATEDELDPDGPSP